MFNNNMSKAINGNGQIQFELPVANYDRFIQTCLPSESDSKHPRSESITTAEVYFLGWYPGKTKGRFIENDSLGSLYRKVVMAFRERCYAIREFSVQP